MYTTVDLVRPYLTADYPVYDQVCDQPVQLTDSTWSKFYGGSIDPTALKVKSRRDYTLTRQQFTLPSSPLVLSSAPLVPNSIIVASDSSLGTIYIENTDYLINYTTRTLSLPTGSRLSPGNTVTIWFESFHLYQSGEDYQLDSEHSQLRRLTSGAVSSGETVFLDYIPIHQSFLEDTLISAVNEANGLIEHDLDPNAQFDADPTLVAAATCRALEIVCRSAATRELSSLRGQDKIALAWLKLSEDYSARADSLLQSFRPPVVGPNHPTLS